MNSETIFSGVGQCFSIYIHTWLFPLSTKRSERAITSHRSVFADKAVIFLRPPFLHKVHVGHTIKTGHWLDASFATPESILAEPCVRGV